jgi:hypothetical protein
MRWRSHGAVVVTLLALVAVVWFAEAEAKPRAVRILAEYPVPAEPSSAWDIRWASDNSVYLMRIAHGVSEVVLDAALTQRRQPVPDLETLNLVKRYDILAASERYLAFASPSFELAWRPVGGKRGGNVEFKEKQVPVVAGIDLHGDRLLLLGWMDGKHEQAVVWTGTLGTGLGDLRPVLFDSEPRETILAPCIHLRVGGVSYLDDGSFVAVPVLPEGAFLFDPSGKLVRTWTHEQTGLFTDCSKLSREEYVGIVQSREKTIRWFNRHRVIDEILPLPQGPGLVLRSLGKDGKVYWTFRCSDRAGSWSMSCRSR